MTLPLPRPNVQINPERRGPARLTPKEQQAIAEISDPVLRRTLGEMFLAARGNQENFDELAQQFPIQPANVADAISEQVPEGEPGQVFEIDKEGNPTWVNKGGQWQQIVTPEIELIEFPQSAGAATLDTLVSRTGIPRGLLYFSAQYGKTGSIPLDYASTTTTNAGSGESAVFPSWAHSGVNTQAGLIYPFPQRLRLVRGTKWKSLHWIAYISAPKTLSVTGPESIEIAKASTKVIEVTKSAPAGVLFGWAMLVRPGGEKPLSRSDVSVSSVAGTIEGGAEGLADVQMIAAPVAGNHTFKWTFEKEASAAARVMWAFIA